MRTIPILTGDEIRIIAPSDSQRLDKQRRYSQAQKRLEEHGYKVTYGKHLDSKLHLGTGHAKERAEDFNDAYRDTNVRAVFCMHGGWSANEILPYIDWEVVKNNPKPLIGYSDITVLLNAVYAKTQVHGFLGPNFGTLGYDIGWEYSLDNLVAALQQKSPRILEKSTDWYDGDTKHKTKNWTVLQPGSAEGILLGGNISTFYLVQGTEYQPTPDTDFILAIEDDQTLGEFTIHGLARSLESILQLPGARQNLKGLLIGRFEPGSKLKPADLASVIAAKNLTCTPVIANMDFGHTQPMLTLPIGGKVAIEANSQATVTVLQY